MVFGEVVHTRDVEYQTCAHWLRVRRDDGHPRGDHGGHVRAISPSVRSDTPAPAAYSDRRLDSPGGRVVRDRGPTGDLPDCPRDVLPDVPQHATRHSLR